ncbi:gas vesicle protein GvpO [Streptomyces sp. NBC_01803]|uniref:gas vesicle protein GvpO n=1 Tax=Streptomyces sp. NBC_01803 TaxID=2975946 RepID=UPI002DD9AAB2|nr:gas vesicle protein [Streptomyces sp. NBC_01803]WSA46941.1 gas vesicle protein [Streptomyces sp. NBC_01803]
MAENEEHEKQRSDDDNSGAAGGSRPALDVIRTAGAEFAELTGLRAEAVTRFERDADGWVLETEVTELARVPDTMSLMATYEVTTDPDGGITGYRRVQRYERGRADRR